MRKESRNPPLITEECRTFKGDLESFIDGSMPRSAELHFFLSVQRQSIRLEPSQRCLISSQRVIESLSYRKGSFQ